MNNPTISLILNEHSLPSEWSSSSFQSFAKEAIGSFKAAQALQNSIKNIRISSESKQVIANASYADNRDKTLTSLLLKLLNPPYLVDAELAVEQSDDYLRFTAHCSVPTIANSECFLTAAIYGFPLLSRNIDHWQECFITGSLIINDEPSEKKWENIYDEHSPAACHTEYLSALAPATPPVSGLALNEVDIHLQDHHGTHIIRPLAEKLRRSSPYILRIESDEWKSELRRFYRKSTFVEGHWYLHLTLYRTAEGFGLLVRTTARTQYEADYIANQLERLY